MAVSGTGSHSAAQPCEPKKVVHYTNAPRLRVAQPYADIACNVWQDMVSALNTAKYGVVRHATACRNSPGPQPGLEGIAADFAMYSLFSLDAAIPPLVPCVR